MQTVPRSKARHDKATVWPSMRTTSWFLSVLGASLMGCAQPPSASEPVGEWRRWRGPNGQGISQEANLPTTWSEGSRNIRWKTWTPGGGNSSPIASRGRVFLTTTYGIPKDDWDTAWYAEDLQRVVLAIDSKSGALLWQTTIFSGPKGKIHHGNSRAAPTPVTDGRHVFVAFDHTLAALDFEGKMVWQKNIDPDYYQYAHYGVSTSPVVVGDLVVVQQDREESTDQDVGWIAAFDKKTGERVWRDEWTYTCCSYTTPILLDRGEGALELAMSTSKEIVVYEPETGERLWVASHTNNQPVPSLLVAGDLLVAPGGVHETSLVVHRLSGRGKTSTSTQLWQTKRSIPQIPTSLLYAGRLFVLKDNGVLTAYRPETGERIWQGRASPGNYWPSLVAGDGKLYATNQYGVVSVIDAQADGFTLLAENAVGDGTHGATPAIASGCLLLRTKNHLYCIENADPASRGSGTAG